MTRSDVVFPLFISPPCRSVCMHEMILETKSFLIVMTVSFSDSCSAITVDLHDKSQTRGCQLPPRTDNVPPTREMKHGSRFCHRAILFDCR